jgi:hypothetical protein
MPFVRFAPIFPRRHSSISGGASRRPDGPTRRRSLSSSSHGSQPIHVPSLAKTYLHSGRLSTSNSSPRRGWPTNGSGRTNALDPIAHKENSTHGKHIHLCSADDEPEVLEQPADLVLESREELHTYAQPRSIGLRRVRGGGSPRRSKEGSAPVHRRRAPNFSPSMSALPGNGAMPSMRASWGQAEMDSRTEGFVPVRLSLKLRIIHAIKVRLAALKFSTRSN